MGGSRGAQEEIGHVPKVPRSSRCGVFIPEPRLERECRGEVNVVEGQAFYVGHDRGVPRQGLGAGIG